MQIEFETKQLDRFKDSFNYPYVADYYNYLKYDRNVGEARIDNCLRLLGRYDKFLHGKDFMKVMKEDNQRFLLRNKRSDEEDSLHKWIGTYNQELIDLTTFHRWLYNKNKDPQDWETPHCIRLRKIKRTEDSPYNDSDVWSEEEVNFVASKLAESPRDAFIVTALYDLAALRKDLVNIRLKHINIIENKDHRWTTITISAKKRQRTIPLYLSYPYVKDMINAHPFRNDPDAFAIVNRYTCKKLGTQAIYNLLQRMREKLKRMVKDNELKGKDLALATNLLKKPWNTNLVGRHSSLTEKAKELNDATLKGYAGWSQSTRVPKRYIHYNNVIKPLLEYYGLAKKEPNQRGFEHNKCPRCKHVNKPLVKFCENKECGFVLSFEGWEELQKEEVDLKNQVKQLNEQMEHVNRELARMEKSKPIYQEDKVNSLAL